MLIVNLNYLSKNFFGIFYIILYYLDNHKVHFFADAHNFRSRAVILDSVQINGTYQFRRKKMLNKFG